ncbi:MAG: hypothetical protein HY454_02865 [Parcubacteria group bacterium]|nr:hypothetical protein [Parcubacteria group bacterium]
MTISVLRNNKYLGTLDFDASNAPVWQNGFDDELADFVRQSLEKGIIRLRDIETDSGRVIIKEPIRQTDPLFPLAFKEWLRGHGYLVREEHPETDERIKQSLNQFPNDWPAKTKILNELSNMSHLEKTFILEKLEDKVSER